jgi:sulfatase modifying factor 1
MKKIFLFGLLGMVAAFSSCRKSEVSSTTGWEYNNPDFGGFEKVADKGQATGPNLVFIPGGRFTMGVTEEDVMKDYNNRSRTVTVNSFYMDETEVSNIDYLLILA